MRWTKAEVSVSPSYQIGYQNITLVLNSPNDKMDEFNSLIKGKYEINISRQKKKRTLTANAYCWMVCDELAKVLKISKEEVYQRAIKQVGVYEPMSIKKTAYSRFKEVWEGRGTGWILDRLIDDGINIECNAYYGSSTYDSKEMARLIDWLVDEAESQGLDVMTPSERALLIDSWGKEKANG